MKKGLIFTLCGVCLTAAAINFAAVFINNRAAVEAETEPVPFQAISSPFTTKNISAELDEPDMISEENALNDPMKLAERQVNRYNLSKFYRELKLGTSANSYTLSVHLDSLGIPYSSISIKTPELTYDDRMQLLAMSAMQSDYNADNIAHFESYACNLWAFTHYITVNGNSYPASVLTGITEEGKNLTSQFHDDILDEYNNNGYVVFEFTPSEESYYELDRPQHFAWSEEKISEAETLKNMSYPQLIGYILDKNDELSLYSPVILYNQGSGTWNNCQFGGGTVKSDGCCPTSISMVLSYFKNERITPDVVATLYDYDEYRSIEGGSFGVSMCRKAASDFGLDVIAGSGVLSPQEIEYYLGQGSKIVVSVKGYDASTGTGGDYSAVFHYIVLAGMTSDGYVIVNNPGFITDVSYDTASKVSSNLSGKCYAIFSEK